MKTLTTLLFITITCLSHAQVNWKKMDPYKTAATFVKDFNKLSKEDFINKYCVSIGDEKYLVECVESAKGLKPEKKERFKKEVTDLNLNDKVKESQEEVGESYDFLKANLSSPVYEDCYYEVELEDERIAPELRLYIIVKDQDNYYQIRFKKGLFINNSWKTIKPFKLYQSDVYGDRDALISNNENYSEGLETPLEETSEEAVEEVIEEAAEEAVEEAVEETVVPAEK